MSAAASGETKKSTVDLPEEQINRGVIEVIMDVIYSSKKEYFITCKVMVKKQKMTSI